MNQLKTGAILNYIVLGLNAMVGIAYTPYMLRMLGQSEYGLYALAASVIAYLSILDLGFGNAVIRYTAKYRAEGKIQEQYPLLGMFTVLYLITGVIVLCAGLFLCFNADNLFGQTMTPIEIERAQKIMILMTLNLAVTFPLSIYGAVITAYENFIFLRVVQIVRIILNMVVMVCLLNMGYKALAMVIAQTIFNVLVLLLNVVYCKHKMQIKIVFGKWDKPLFREIMLYSFWIFLNVIMDRVYWSTGQFVLGMTLGTIAVSVFAVAIQLEGMYMMFSTAISGVFLPRVTSMVAAGNNSNQISELFIKTGRVQYVVLSFILSGFIVFGSQFIRVWAGESYQEAYVITLLFFIPLTIPLIQNIGVIILQARNQMKFRSIVYISIALCSFGLQIPLTKMYGGVGCAIAIAVALTIGQIIIMNIYYYRVQKLDIFRFWKEIGRMSIFPAIICLIFGYITKSFEIDSILQLGGWIALFSIIYWPLFFRLSMNGYERDLMLKPLRKIFSR